MSVKFKNRLPLIFMFPCNITISSFTQALWRNRQQVWQRLEENGQISMKVAPSQIEFTLPSPKLGIESLPVIDPPWVPKFKTKINTIHERGQVSITRYIVIVCDCEI